MTPWVQLDQLIEPYYPKVVGAGRPLVGLARMLRSYVSQQYFGLSEEGIEHAIYDSDPWICPHRPPPRGVIVRYELPSTQRAAAAVAYGSLT